MDQFQDDDLIPDLPIPPEKINAPEVPVEAQIPDGTDVAPEHTVPGSDDAHSPEDGSPSEEAPHGEGE